MRSPNLTDGNIARIRELFPGCVTEIKDEGGRMKAKKKFEVLFVDENALIACFDTGVSEELVKELAQYKPLRVVFRDTGFTSDTVKINVDQIFKQLSPGTEVKSI